MAVAMASGSLAACPGLKLAIKCSPSIRSYYSHRSFRLVVPVPSRARLPSLVTARIPKATSQTAVEDGSSNETGTIPTPKVIIDQDSDPDATIVEITFGDRLGALLDTMKALKNLGLNVNKANVYLDSSGKHNKFAITKASTGRKIDDPELLEAIRLTIINNMLQYHPIDVDIATHIDIYDDGPDWSLLVVETADRPGLLVDLVKIITDINITVQSGEFDTEGLLAKAKFHVSYRDKPISKPLQQASYLLICTLQ
ncbi:ACT domain-containing protein DS12, chloroplastic [Cocos nucifera]|uniref:ACT domain-containing protein ACR n=1 Tax=Cocos nucifera TaxID=13894 RepID=A0A8K0HVK2_COCNU|nr:ACT domain-containing protein DS12, chloroplastic [Cocos nucifera]